MGAEAAAGAGQRREVGVGEIGAGDAAGISPLLMHPDGAVHAVVADDHNQRQPVSTAVMNSSPVIWKQPSPANAMTVRSGCCSLAATATGRP